MDVPFLWSYSGLGAGVAALIWNAFRPLRSRQKYVNHALLAVIMFVFAAILVPSLQPLWVTRIHSPCVANLKQIQAAKTAWTRLFPSGFSKTPQEDDLFGAGKYMRERPTCPEGGSYRLGSLNEFPTCSLVGTRHRLHGTPSYNAVPIMARKMFSILCGVGLVAFLRLLWAVWRVKRLGPKLSLAGLAAALLLAIYLGLPVIATSRVGRSRSACSANLQQIQQAKERWAVELKKARTDVPRLSDLAGPDKYLRDDPICPLGGFFRLGAVREKPTCSFGNSYPGHTFDFNQ